MKKTNIRRAWSLAWKAFLLLVLALVVLIVYLATRPDPIPFIYTMF